LKFSILLPTRNRLDLLKHAVQSVLLQDYPDWEIVISDNASDDDVRGFVSRMNDLRIRYWRSEKVLPVTENWNHALAEASGDYLIMLGDDDCLLPTCLSTAKSLLEVNGMPELLYTEAAQFAYPGVFPRRKSAFIQFGYCAFLKPPPDRPFFLEREAAVRCVREAARFHFVYSYNMQHSIISRTAIRRLQTKGSFFQSPYPDYYATNALLLSVDRILICPWPLTIIGITQKSFGFYYVNDREAEGVEYLKNIPDPGLVERVQGVLLPGSNLNTSWLLAMEAVRQNFGDGVGLRVEYWRYRFMQWRVLWKSLPGAEFQRMLREDSQPRERQFWKLVMLFDRAFGRAIITRRVWNGVLRRLLDAIHRSHPHFDSRHRDVPFANILELARSDMGSQWRPREWKQLVRAA
jgi:glycosyltransferase involved in cell wall biosynthesis